MSAKSSKRPQKKAPLTNLDLSIHHNIVNDLTAFIRDTRDEHYKVRYLESEFLSKINDPNGEVSPMDRQRAALKKWLDVELRNERTNQRLKDGDYHFLKYNYPATRGLQSLYDETIDKTICGLSVAKVLKKARAFAEEVIGPEPLECLPNLGSYSNGASYFTPAARANDALKFGVKSEVTDTLPDFFKKHYEKIRSNVGDTRELDYLVAPGNCLFTVPKNHDIDRVACKEPSLNMYYQKAVGEFIRTRLKKNYRHSIDLRDQSRNRSLAYRGSLPSDHKDHLDICTIDLSSASDTITLGLVSRVIPLEWVLFMDSIRSHNTVLPKGITGYADDVIHKNSMFSAMGNGFTFELESLIFLSLVRAICYLLKIHGPISVYGDDIIAPTKAFKPLMHIFGFLGLKFNPKKSFATGPFRESCGGHYYAGTDVTPFYIRRPIDNVRELITFLNNLRRWSNVNGICDPRVYEMYQKYASLVVNKRAVIPAFLRGGYDTSDSSRLASPLNKRAIKDTFGNITLVPDRDYRNYSRVKTRTFQKRTSEAGAYLVWHSKTTQLDTKRSVGKLYVGHWGDTSDDTIDRDAKKIDLANYDAEHEPLVILEKNGVWVHAQPSPKGTALQFERVSAPAFKAAHVFGLERGGLPLFPQEIT